MAKHGIISGLYCFIMFTVSLVASNEEIDVILTDARVAEIGYHVTMFTMRMSSTLSHPVTFSLVSKDEDVAFPLQKEITFNEHDETLPKIIYIYGNKVGETHIMVKFNSSVIKQNKENNRAHIIVKRTILLQSINFIIGWLYFIAWSVSFYPQVYINFKRRSVVGLNFDFLAYNITGFLAYSFFNGGLYYSKAIQEEYFKKYGGAVIPVQTNDVFFAFHAVAITTVTILQCFLFERGGQKISRVAKILLTLMWLFALVSLIPAALKKITWLTYLNFFSYIKLAVTLIKYIPQALMNYRRKSTVGWSIGNIFLDFTGGSLSLLQMFFLSYNNNQWNSIFGDFTKFGLGLFSILFDILFMLQHYVFYRDSKYQSGENDTKNSESDPFHGDVTVNQNADSSYQHV